MAIMSCVRIVPNREMSIDEFKAWLKRFDSDHDGNISREELQQALHSLHAWFGWWKARQGMKEADANGNSKIDGDKEIYKLVAFAQQHLNMKIYETGW